MRLKHTLQESKPAKIMLYRFEGCCVQINILVTLIVDKGLGKHKLTPSKAQLFIKKSFVPEVCIVSEVVI